MPTATTTTLTLPRKSLKPAPSPALESLYNRAARAFLLRDIPLVNSLLEAAFPLLHPPEQGDYPDDLAPYRAKWDLLRITLETTLFAAPTPDVPESLRQLLSQPPHSLLTSTYHRSLQLFTPTNTASKALYIPSAVILTLVYSSLKLDAADAGRIVVEDWLATRAYLSLPSSSADDEERSNYRKVVEAYCLHILPKLEQWDYAKEFLDYESELARDARESIRVALEDLYAQAISARLPTPRPPQSSSFSHSTPRPHSPTPSSSSSSSLSSTASMHTVVPATPRPRSNLKSETYRRASSSSASTSTATPRTRSKPLPNASPPRVQPQQLLPRMHNPGGLRTAPPPSTYAILKASIVPYLTSTTRLSVISFASFVLLLVLPLILRRRRAAQSRPEIASGNAELVRRRLLAASAVSGGRAGILGRVLAATIRVVGDTIRMGGSGLV